MLLHKAHPMLNKHQMRHSYFNTHIHVKLDIFYHIYITHLCLYTTTQGKSTKTPNMVNQSTNPKSSNLGFQ